MYTYLDFLRDILDSGTQKEDRTETGTLSVFARQMRFNLTRVFPLVTTKKMYLKGIIHELLWFLSGNTNIAYLQEHNVHIWNEWVDKNGDLGPIYGRQWTAWETKDGNTINQIANVIEEIKSNPSSRRLIVSAWNVGELPNMALPPVDFSYVCTILIVRTSNKRNIMKTLILFISVLLICSCTHLTPETRERMKEALSEFGKQSLASIPHSRVHTTCQIVGTSIFCNSY